MSHFKLKMIQEAGRQGEKVEGVCVRKEANCLLPSCSAALHVREREKFQPMKTE